MTSKRSEILKELDENIMEIEKLISQQTFRVGDAQLFLERYFNHRRKLEQAIARGDKWKAKAEDLKNQLLEFKDVK